MASIKVRSDASRAERTVDESVGSFDGYLVLKSEDVRASALHRFWTADDVQKFMRSGEIEAMIAEFVAEWWRTILLPNGVLVQALPKGGWVGGGGGHSARDRAQCALSAEHHPGQFPG